MTSIPLYTGGGVSLSPTNGAGRRLSAYVRLIADEGMGITDGRSITVCADTRRPELWSDCPLPEPEEEETEE